MKRLDGNRVSKIVELSMQNVDAHYRDEEITCLTSENPVFEALFFLRILRSTSRYNSAVTVVLLGTNS